MADDIDDLLDEVETKYGEKKMNVIDGPKRAKPKIKNKLEEDINDILSDTHVDDEFMPSRPVKADSVAKSHSGVNQRCYAVYLGGSDQPTGQATAISQRACNNLRCTGCDFRVCQFNNYKWTSDTNYLFLRNNVPDFEKLKPKLSDSKGHRAYCCQCSWRTVKDLTQLADPALKWHCAKH